MQFRQYFDALIYEALTLSIGFLNFVLEQTWCDCLTIFTNICMASCNKSTWLPYDGNFTAIMFLLLICNYHEVCFHGSKVCHFRVWLVSVADDWLAPGNQASAGLAKFMQGCFVRMAAHIHPGWTLVMFGCLNHEHTHNRLSHCPRAHAIDSAPPQPGSAEMKVVFFSQEPGSTPHFLHATGQASNQHLAAREGPGWIGTRHPIAPLLNVLTIVFVVCRI